MKNLPSLLTPSKEKNSQGKPIVSLNRDEFRKNPAFSWAYDGVKENDFAKLYGNLYLSYEKISTLIKPEPPIKNPKEFQREINDKDILEIEECLAIMFTLGLNVTASILDNGTERPFVPRDPTKDGSYEDARKGLAENQ
ncbi:MAG: hypothetical protein AABW47_03860 [Nanoarchaeota archaeon]